MVFLTGHEVCIRLGLGTEAITAVMLRQSYDLLRRLEINSTSIDTGPRGLMQIA